MEGEGQTRLLHGHRIYIPDLDDEIVTVHAIFDDQIPHRSQEYCAGFDNISTEMSDKPEKCI